MNVTDVGLKHLAQCKQLQGLGLSGIRGVTDSALLQLFGLLGTARARTQWLRGRD